MTRCPSTPLAGALCDSQVAVRRGPRKSVGDKANRKCIPAAQVGDTPRPPPPPGRRTCLCQATGPPSREARAHLSCRIVNQSGHLLQLPSSGLHSSRRLCHLVRGLGSTGLLAAPGCPLPPAPPPANNPPHPSRGSESFPSLPQAVQSGSGRGCDKGDWKWLSLIAHEAPRERTRGSRLARGTQAALGCLPT